MPDQFKVKIIRADGSEDHFWTLPGKSVYQILEMMGNDTGGTCAGNGTCGKCKVRVEGAVSPMEPAEQALLMPEEIRSGERVACHCMVQGEAFVYLDLLASEYNVKNRIMKYTPAKGQSGVELRTIFIPGRQQDAMVPLYNRLQSALPKHRLNISMKNLNELYRIDRPGRPTLELQALIFDEQEVRLFEKESSSVFGLALDLGTTSLFAALLDLQTGEIAAMATHSNMQRIYGQDIMTRLSYVQEHDDGAEVLHQILINNINAMIEDMAGQTGYPPERIFKVSVVGNPVMLHFFLNLNTAGFGMAPYTGLFSNAVQVDCLEMGLNLNPLAKLMILPQLGGFVGADTTACLLTLSKCLNSTFLLLDIGTNGEIVVCSRGKMWASSAAAGPALEGGALSSGMRAGIGAIERIRIEDKQIAYDVIGGGAPKGICGSAVVDLIAGLLENDCLDAAGIYTAAASEYFQVRSGNRGQEILLVESDATSGNAAIVFNQEDIRQIQLAKSAIRTTIEILLKEAGLKAADLETVYLAGAFGSYLNAAHLIKLGMLPDVKSERVLNIGNAAAEGAMMALVSRSCLNEANRIKQQVRSVELANHPGFQEFFLHHLGFQ